MAKKEKKSEEKIKENISIESLDNLMGDRFGIYAKYVIQDRAIPDARDGLKPVQRRIIYCMWNNGNTYDKGTKKCAKIVGDVMGRFHPHGDSSIYEALVRLSQSWKMSAPLIHFQGNNGSIDNDPPAAYRYTEAKLNELSGYLIQDIQKETVDMTLNFDDTELEPIVLPARFPNLYVNGSEGIAVAIATEIPTHNLVEVSEATIYRINHPHCDLDELLEIIKGPDFPTGGIIYSSSGIKDIYETGKGRIEVASKVDVDTSNKDYNELIITEIPYNVIKQQLVFSIDKIKKSKEIDGILDVKDLSAGDTIRIVIDLKKEVDPQIVITYLMNKTQLKVSYSSNIVAICNDHPRTLTLTSYLDTYIAHQVEVITRRTNFDLNKTNKRLNIVEGLIKAISVVDEVVKIIRNSKDKEDAKKNLVLHYKFNEEQVEAIVMMRLYKLSNTDIKIYIEEKDALRALLKDLQETLDNPTKLKKIIISDLKDVIKKFGIARRTQIVEKTNEIQIDKRDLIAKEDTDVVITKDGYIKRSSLKSVKSSNNSLPGVKEGDAIVMNMVVSTLDYILAFTDKGNYIFIPVHEIVEGKWKDEGKHINYMCNLPLEEAIIKCIVVKNFDKNVSICLVSKNGQIKKSALKDFFTNRYSRPITCMKLLSSDEVVDVSVANGNSDLFIITKAGLATFFNESEISSSGLKTSGVKAISTLKNSTIGGLLSFRKKDRDKILILLDKGMYRIFDINKLELTGRLKFTQTVFKSFKSDPYQLVLLTKIKNKNQPFAIDCLMNNDSIMSIKIEDFSLTPIDKMAKKNLDFDDSLSIKDVYLTSVQVIDDKTIEEKGVINKSINDDDNKDKDPNDGTGGYEQISIFDNMGD